MKEEVFSRTTRIERPAAEVFAWHARDGALARLCPPWERVEIASARGGIRDGAEVKVRTKVGPLWLNWEVEHREFVEGVQFRDVQVKGPFARWEHLHRVVPQGERACVLTDEIVYRIAGGAVGALLGGSVVRRRLERMFAWRHATTKADLERAASGASGPKRVLVAGASGLIGGALVPYLRTQGHTVLRLVRRAPCAPDEIFWNPAAGELDPAAIEDVDAFVNLGGENVAAGRWTAARKHAILRSRAQATRTLVRALKRLARKPEAFVSASATGYYGDRGNEVLREGSRSGSGFLPEVCRAWEAEARAAEGVAGRVAVFRLGVVLTPAGGALGRLLPVFRAGGGGRVGNGRQWMSWVGIDDVVEAMGRAIVDGGYRGEFNLVAPEPATNAEFAATLGRVLARPAVLPAPAALLRAVFGEMAEEALLASARAIPERLIERGYRFRHATLEPALRHVLGR